LDIYRTAPFDGITIGIDSVIIRGCNDANASDRKIEHVRRDCTVQLNANDPQPDRLSLDDSVVVDRLMVRIYYFQRRLEGIIRVDTRQR
jgi:hypothetical protein